MEITGLSDTTIWRLTRSGALPAPVRLSPGRVGWPSAVIDAWLATRQPTTDTQTAA
jgi:prophage regulatory protein